MRHRPRFEGLSLLARLAAAGLVSGLTAACSSDTMRFAGDPFANPFSRESRADPVATGSLPPAEPMPTASIQSAPLAPLASPAPAIAPSFAGPAPAGTSAAPSGVAAPIPAARAAAQQSGPAGWTAYGGTPIMVGPGESLTTIANRYNIPASAILSANGLSSAAQVTAGRSIVIPVYNAVNAGPRPSVVPAAPIAAPQSTPRIVEPARSAEIPRPPAPERPRTRVAEAKPDKPQMSRRDDAPPAVPARPAAAATAAQGQLEARKPAAPVAERVEQKAKSVEVAAVAPAATVAKEQPSAPPAVKEPERTASLPDGANGLDFRWPARGRVTVGFGTGGNEGINIAVPEGTPVKAAETGTVAYAGSELKGYGNLVLVRHDNGYVSAYAHNEELLVKRGDKVRRGQVIAKSGRTGNVTAPQLHFEIRKGSTPVDPIPYLSN